MIRPETVRCSWNLWKGASSCEQMMLSHHQHCIPALSLFSLPKTGSFAPPSLHLASSQSSLIYIRPPYSQRLNRWVFFFNFRTRNFPERTDKNMPLSSSSKLYVWTIYFVYYQGLSIKIHIQLGLLQSHWNPSTQTSTWHLICCCSVNSLRPHGLQHASSLVLH